MNQIRTWLYWLISALILSGVTDVFAKFQNTSVNAAILVNSQRTERHAEYYRLELGINNASGPAYEQAIATDGTNTTSGYIFLPPTQESFVYDADGNQIPVNMINRGGNTLILNTRTAQTLERAGIPRSQWNGVNQTGNPLFEQMLTDQLRRNQLSPAGTPLTFSE